MVPYYPLVLLLHVNFGAILVQGANSFGNGPGKGLKVDYEWTTVDYLWPDSRTKDKAVKKGRYDPTRVAILDVDVYDPAAFGYYQHNAEKKIFVTTPKFQPGVPVSLATVSKKFAQDGSSLLEPFPNWLSHSEKDCDGLTSVYRVQIDECERLWVLDTGKVATFTNNPKKLCQPQLVVYDLKNNNKIHLRHRFPEDQLEANSLLITVAVDTRKCSSQYAYVADVNGYQLLVYDATKRQSWRITSNYFHPFPNYGSFDLNGAQFDLMDGVFGLALGPLINNNRRVYFHALASVKEGWTYASTLLNQSLFENNLTPTALFELSEYDRNSQSSSEVMSNEGIMFFPLLISNSLVCWNAKTVYKQDNFVTLYKNDQLFQFVSGLKLKSNKDLYVLTSRLQNYIVTSQTDTSQVNYRILVARTGDLTRNTACDVASSTNQSNNWGYEVIENLIEDDKREHSPYKSRKHQSESMAPIREYDQSSGQQSQEKPLRMYYDSSDEGRSIEKYIHGRLSHGQEDEEYLRRRHSFEDLPVPLRNIPIDIAALGDGETEDKPVEKSKAKNVKLVKGPFKSGSLKKARPAVKKSSKTYQVETQNNEISSSEWRGKDEEGENTFNDFDMGEFESLENDPEMQALVAKTEAPLQPLYDVSKVSKDIFTHRDPVFTILGQTPRPTNPTSRHQMSLPYPPYHVTGSPHRNAYSPHKNAYSPLRDAYSFEMLSNNEPSAPLVFKTQLRQFHAQPIDKLNGLGHPKKCKQQGKGQNSVSCLNSNLKKPSAMSYQQTEFFRSPGT